REDGIAAKFHRRCANCELCSLKAHKKRPSHLPMSTTTLNPPQPAARPTSEWVSRNMVRIGVDKLAVGKQLTYPVYDQGGLLLLAEGSLITPRFKDLLCSRNIAEVHLHPEDAARIVNGTRSRPARSEHASGPVKIESDVTRKLDALVDSGTLQVGNTGPAVRDRMVMFAKKPYDPRQRERLVEHHTQAI